MNNPIKILIIEHSQSDVDLIIHELNKSSMRYIPMITYTESTYLSALTDFSPDIILSDYTLPSFDGATAFLLKQQVAQHVPFIFVTGTIKEEKAAQLIRNGASDYVLKDALYTLPDKINRALQEADDRKEKVISAEKLSKANHLYALISQVNQNIVRVTDEATLFRNSCRLAIEYGKFQIAWIGIFNPAKETISLVEQYGMADADTSLFADVAYAKGGPQFTVLRTGSYFICNNILTDLHLEGWTTFAETRGLNSCVILPFKKSGKIAGTFNLYSSELNFSGPDEIKLLVELTSDISFALELFEKEKKQQATDLKLAINETRFRVLIEKGADLKTLSTKDGNFFYASPSVSHVMGYSNREILQMNVRDILHPDDADAYVENRKQLLSAEDKSLDTHMRFKHKNGTWIWCDGTITNMLKEPGIHALVSNFRDVSEKKQAEQQKEFDKNNLSALINNTDDLLWSVDREFKLITSNHSFDAMGKVQFGHVLQQGESILDVSLTPEMHQHFKQQYERAFSGESYREVSHFDHPFEFWTEISYAPIRKGDEIIGAVCNSRDITESKIAEKKLKESEAFSSAILNSLTSHIAVIDSSGLIVAVNASWERFAKENGASSLLSTGVGSNYYHVCEKSVLANAPGASEALNGTKDVMNGTKTDYYMEYPCNSPDVKRWFGLTVLKLGGGGQMVVVSHQDISERKLAEENLRKSESRLKEAQAISHIGNWEIDFASGVHTWSEEMFCLFRIDKAHVNPSLELFLSFIHPDDLEQIKSDVDEAFTKLTATSYDFRFIRTDGELRYGHTERKFEFDNNKKPLRLLGVMHDVTERRIIEEERDKMISSLVQHTKNLEQFTSIVSHNLRAPVANILGLSGVLKNKLTPEDRTKSEQYLFAATTQLDGMLKDLNIILQAKVEINEYKESVNLDELIETIKFSIQTLIEHKMVRIVTDFSNQENIFVIRTYIYSIFYNLITNSIKYMQRGIPAVISIRSESDQSKVRICFKDNGIGIDMDKYSSQVFGLYKRFHPHTEGKGLGLFMVKTQVETLGGTIRIESELNHGTEFNIELPL